MLKLSKAIEDMKKEARLEGMAEERKNIEKVKNDNDFKKVSNEAVGLINEVTNSDFEKNAEGGYVNMCKAIDDMKNKAEAKGKNEGIVETEARVKVETVVNFYKNGVSLDIISKSIGISIDDVKNILIHNNVELRVA